MRITTRGGVVSQLLENVPLPRMFRARQTFPRPVLTPEEIPGVVRAEMSREPFVSKLQPGMTIAITAGSRGIANVALITRSIVEFCKERGTRPFIVPAMGSHGGATAEGQREILAGYGITEEAMGCEIRSSMETVYLGMSRSGRPVYMDKNAYEADGIIVSCRLKPHNAFRGKVESGPCKMMAVGLGKQKGAENVHADGMGKIAEHIPSMAQVFLEKAPILFAIPSIENAYDETCKIVAIDTPHLIEEEAEWLKFAFANMPSLLVKEADVLVVDEIGKNYSGTGVDPNIAGTFSTEYAHGGLKVQRTCFLDLSEASHGNALGIGLANCITARLFNKIDMDAMYPNIVTNTVFKSGMIPFVVPTDKEAIQLCIRTTNGVDRDPAKVRVVRIPNTSHIGTVMLSESYYEAVRAGKYPHLEALDEPAPLAFDDNGTLLTKI
ncbi:lactate racemase domain-containing protein [Acidaminococcus fermentans]|uniref:lactate racemase domain-containing protein n=1 Tax=Acidaminococcus fermentans TaxID=905 RepID=UPI00248F4851|nr:lactate racemase domain-containing protein [Acidaminococcus fermentans]